MQKSGIMAHILALAHIVPTSGVDVVNRKKFNFEKYE
jgi:hypothetical protein